jgi:hypothetical protein
VGKIKKPRGFLFYSQHKGADGIRDNELIIATPQLSGQQGLRVTISQRHRYANTTLDYDLSQEEAAELRDMLTRWLK